MSDPGDAVTLDGERLSSRLVQGRRLLDLRPIRLG
jgi:hypothetical protein